MFKHLLFVVLACVTFASSAMEVMLTDGLHDLKDGDLKIARTKLIYLPAGTVLTIDYTVNDGVDDAKFSLTTNYGKQVLPGFSPVDENNFMHVTKSGSYDYVLTAEVLKDLNDSNFHHWDGNIEITGSGLTITQVYYTLDDTEQLISGPINLNDKDWKGLEFPRNVIVRAEAGWKIVMDYTLNDGAINAYFRWATSYGNKPVPGFTGTETNSDGKSVIPVHANGTYIYEITAEEISSLNNSDIHGWDNSIHIMGSGITITKLELVRYDNGGTTGITSINVDDNDAPVRYYTLQGVEVSQPGTGIYIRVQGKKASKVIVR